MEGAAWQSQSANIGSYKILPPVRAYDKGESTRALAFVLLIERLDSEYEDLTITWRGSQTWGRWLPQAID